MNKKMLFILNPFAGKAQIKNKLLDIINIFTQNGYDVTVHPTQKEMDAYHVVQQNYKDYEVVVCAGGDGTLNEVVKGLMACNGKVKLGYIPSGTMNDFATSLKLSKNMIHAAKEIVGGESFLCDIGCFNEQYFTYIAAFGAFTDVAYRTTQQAKNILGRLAYILEGIKRLHTMKAYHLIVTQEDCVIEDDFIFGMVTNSDFVGGFKGLSGKGVVLNDGLFEVMLVKMPQNVMDLNNIIGALATQDLSSEYIYSFRTCDITFVSEEKVPWTLDGEYGGSHQIAKIGNKPDSIEFLKYAIKNK
ncbi:MAG: putative lipid kinase [Oscillospiraceae bacterium]|jgi:YegS/Rv2252/BmrU family lipid kinase|nr:putative lipid kinase [Oscillospiraceae bacterium]